MNKITDNYIKEYFFTKLNKLYTKKFLDFEKTHFPNEIYEYLINRYNDSQSLKETVYRINFGYNVRPVCENCGKPLNFKGKMPKLWDKYCSKECRYSETRQNKIKQTCLEKYGTEYSWQNEEVKEKIKNTHIKNYGVEFPQSTNIIKEKIRQTCLKRYGGNGPMSSKEVQEKSKQTCLEKYGVNYVNQNKEIKDKAKLTCLEKYGVEVPAKSKIIKEKTKQTCLEKYGVEYAFQSEEIKEKIKQTCLEKYGVEVAVKNKEISKKLGNILSSKEVQNKINATKRKNHTFNTSKPENKLYKDIKSIFPSVITQYNKDNRYPWNCDFYIPELDMFIELQGTWMHGGHPFLYSSKEDQELLEKWKLKETKFYNSAIKVWTISDPKKRETAKKNNLNYVELFNNEDINLFLINLQNIKNEKFK